MSQQIRFYSKSVVDFENENVTATASQGSTFAEFSLNRSNQTAWQTTDSVDSDNTTWEVDFGSDQEIDSIILLLHNFKAFTVKYWNGSSYVNFSPAISETTNTKSSNFYDVTSQVTSKVQVRITGTQVANEDKSLCQFIAAQSLGQFQGWPIISKHQVSSKRVINQMLSGKLSVFENTGYFSCNLSVESWSIDDDLALVELLYSQTEGFLVSLCGGDEDQFKTKRIGYRAEDLYLMKCVNEYSANYLRGIYSSGVKISVDLTEVVT